MNGTKAAFVLAPFGGVDPVMVGNSVCVRVETYSVYTVAKFRCPFN